MISNMSFTVTSSKWKLDKC